MPGTTLAPSVSVVLIQNTGTCGADALLGSGVQLVQKLVSALWHFYFSVPISRGKAVQHCRYAPAFGVIMTLGWPCFYCTK